MTIATYDLRWRLSELVRNSASVMLIAANCAATLFINLLGWLLDLSGNGSAADVVQWLALPADTHLLLTRPWTLLTYMWINADLLHLLFNMSWLYCFGRLLELPLSSGRLVRLYVGGGIAGGIAYVFGAVMHWWPAAWLVGPSAAIIAIVIGTAVLLPKLDINLLIIGNVRLLWVALSVLLIYMLDIDGTNPGGNAAHVGGLLAGGMWALARRFDRMDPGARQAFMFGQAKRRQARRQTADRADDERRNVYGRRPASTVPDNERIDPANHERLNQILDKVKRGGYGALSADEKADLFDIAHRIK